MKYNLKSEQNSFKVDPKITWIQEAKHGYTYILILNYRDALLVTLYLIVLGI